MPTDHPHDTIGALVVTDELGAEHRVTIRREDLTTTNAGYWAIRDEIRDEIRDTLAEVFATNRETPHEDRVRIPAEYRYRVVDDLDSNPVREWASQAFYTDELESPELEDWLNPDQWFSHGVIQERRCSACGDWHEEDSVWAFDRHLSHYNDQADGGPLETGTYALAELPEYARCYFSEG